MLSKNTANKSLHLTALPGGRQVFRGLPVPACRRAGADRRSIAAGELGRYIPLEKPLAFLFHISYTVL